MKSIKQEKETEIETKNSIFVTNSRRWRRLEAPGEQQRCRAGGRRPAEPPMLPARSRGVGRAGEEWPTMSAAKIGVEGSPLHRRPHQRAQGSLIIPIYDTKIVLSSSEVSRLYSACSLSHHQKSFLRAKQP